MWLRNKTMRQILLLLLLAGFLAAGCGAREFNGDYKYFNFHAPFGIHPTDTYERLRARGIFLEQFGEKFKLSGRLDEVFCGKGRYFAAFNYNNNFVSHVYFESDDDVCFDYIREHMFNRYGRYTALTGRGTGPAGIKLNFLWRFDNGHEIELTKYDGNFIITVAFNSWKLIDKGTYVIHP